MCLLLAQQSIKSNKLVLAALKKLATNIIYIF